MDFFEAQARAKKRTARLVVLFVLAVAGTIAAMYVAIITIWGQVSPRARQLEQDYWRYQKTAIWDFRDAAVRSWDPTLFGLVTIGTLAVVGVASLYKWNQFSAGGSAVAEGLDARRIDPRTTGLAERRLLNVVEEMAIASGVPVPPVYVLEHEPAINAFAAGLTTSDAVVAVTRGTLDKLSRDELQGVVGHEFSHILNGDMRLNMRLTSLVFGILALGLIGRGILQSLRGVRVRGKGGGGVVAGVALTGLALLIIGYIGYFFGRLVQAAVSRQREFLADASAVQFTRNPSGIAGALKKIGGYALGSSLVSSRSTEIGHFFFAQCFRTGITGWWSTHPPLDERIRALDPAFDGKMYEPPTTVDVAKESFQTAGLVGLGSVGHPVRQIFAALDGAAPPAPPPIPFQPAAAIATIGTVSPDRIDHARDLLDRIPARLRDAGNSIQEARAVVMALLLDDDPAVRARQRNIVATRAAAETLPVLDEMVPLVRSLAADQRLPLLQLSLPALRQIPASELGGFLDVLDELVHADAKMSTFEFALQKLLVRTLELGREPGRALTRYFAFPPVADEIALTLSALACAASRDPVLAPRAFAAGAAQLGLIQDRLQFRADADFVALDAALEKLAGASAPIKQRTLLAAAHTVNADGRVAVEEFELLRAVAAALDCPMPPVAIATG